ncbi:hypothetical protein KP003_02970 [Geomonas nitrogeniifigens]|uniref:hypothetical protein n=1 Tax=Geomonas diazotrophica TaxID=2843197 RepID=UPI001C2BE5A7|nr:hypothetical protein [Geomonas nitrogeniifigens]QXE87387.1 hypothetical protein KP003_02970 [Geomonas nitrogeniifigens]
MATDISTARIWWQKDKLGLHMVSPNHHFFIYAEHLIAIHRSPGEYRCVKRRHRYPDQAIGCHSGEILARLDYNSHLPICQITLLLGEPLRSVELSDDGIKNVVGSYIYSFPVLEFDAFIRVIDIMRRDGQLFDDMMLLADTMP